MNGEMSDLPSLPIDDVDERGGKKKERHNEKAGRGRKGKRPSKFPTQSLASKEKTEKSRRKEGKGRGAPTIDREQRPT